jgi:hypothetical protein
MKTENTMKLVIIFGPPAVGKMTVGYELAKRTGLKLFHNHMTIDPLLNIFEWGQPAFHRLVGEFRRRIFEEVSRSELPGLIFTYVWALDHESDKSDIDSICDIFRTQGAEVFFVELEADLDARLERNETEFRLAQKPSKHNTKRSRSNILDWEGKHKMNSAGDFFYTENYLKLNNTHLSAAEAAEQIITAFEFETL